MEGTGFSGSRYLQEIVPLIERLGSGLPLASIETAGAAVATSLSNGGRVWIAETTHCLHSEATYRAGGLIAVHALRDVAIVEPRDCVIEGSPVGTSELAVACALGVKTRGAKLIALTNVAFELDDRTIREHPSRLSLHEVADIVVDLAGPVGDGVFAHPDDEMRIVPHSGVTGMVAMWMILSEAIDALANQGELPHVYECVMVEGAAEKNAAARGLYLSSGSGVRRISSSPTPVVAAGGEGR